MQLPQFFVFLSGENQSLGINETEALLELRGVNPDISWFGRLGIFETEEDHTRFLRKRGAMLKYSGVVIAEIRAAVKEIECISESKIESVIGHEQSFRIRTQSLDSDDDKELRKRMTVTLGRMIKTVTGASVSLENPDVEFRLFVLGEVVFVCKSIESDLRSHLVKKQSKRLPSFHPSVMNALVAMSMCNLAKLERNHVVLDPYCGVGGILFEASRIGCRVIGMDVEWLRLRGAKNNLVSLEDGEFNLLQGDARSIPLRSCDRIVTDPPYGRASSTYGSKVNDLLSTLLKQIPEILNKEGRACICSCSEMDLYKLAEEMGFTIERKVSIRVHRSLTREIIVLKN